MTTKNLLLTVVLGITTTALSQSNDPVANAAYTLAQDNQNSIHNIATGTNNCYSAYAVSQAYQHANYYNAQIEYSMAVHAREMEKLFKRIREGK